MTGDKILHKNNIITRKIDSKDLLIHTVVVLYLNLLLRKIKKIHEYIQGTVRLAFQENKFEDSSFGNDCDIGSMKSSKDFSILPYPFQAFVKI